MRHLSCVSTKRTTDFTHREEQTSRELSTLLGELSKSKSSLTKCLKQKRTSPKGDPSLTMSLRAQLISSATGLETNVEQGCEMDRHPSKVWRVKSLAT